MPRITISTEEHHKTNLIGSCDNRNPGCLRNSRYHIADDTMMEYKHYKIQFSSNAQPEQHEQNSVASISLHNGVSVQNL